MDRLWSPHEFEFYTKNVQRACVSASCRMHYLDLPNVTVTMNNLSNIVREIHVNVGPLPAKYPEWKPLTLQVDRYINTYLSTKFHSFRLTLKTSYMLDMDKNKSITGLDCLRLVYSCSDNI